MMKFLTLFFLFFAYDFSESANILAIIPTPFYSHQATFRPLWRALAKKGHHITLITTDLMEPNENITQLDYSDTYEVMKDMKKTFVNGISPFEMLQGFLNNMDNTMKFYFKHPELNKLLETKPKFDLVMMELIMPIWCCLSHKFNVPFIGFTTMDGNANLHRAMGNAVHPAIYPMTELGMNKLETFSQRLISTAVFVSITMFVKISATFFGNPLIRKYVAEDCPDMHELERNASLIFVNANPIFFSTRPATPITINLEGGLHIREPEKLPNDLQTYLDQSKDGCIYFSLGSTVNSKALTPEIIEIFRKTFEELAPINVLWKFEDESMPKKPKNLEIRKWLPQQDVLGHPNVKLFITQGGLQSMEEAIDRAVPMLGLPFYGDQFSNINTMVSKKFGLKLDIKNMDKKSLKETILELLMNSIYKENVEKISRIQKDKPMKPVEKAVWWTEYVLRHGGTQHLKSPSADIPLYQYFFLDIIAFVGVVFIFISLLFYFVFKFIIFSFKKLFNRNNKIKSH